MMFKASQSCIVTLADPISQDPVEVCLSEKFSQSVLIINKPMSPSMHEVVENDRLLSSLVSRHVPPVLKLNVASLRFTELRVRVQINQELQIRSCDAKFSTTL